MGGLSKSMQLQQKPVVRSKLLNHTTKKHSVTCCSNNGWVYTACAVCVTNFSTGSKYRPVSNFAKLHTLTWAACFYALLQGPITDVHATKQLIFLFLSQHTGLILRWSVWVYSSDSCSREVDELSSWIRHCTARPGPCCSRKLPSVSEKELHLELPNLQRHRQSHVPRYLESFRLQDTPKLVLVLSASSRRENQTVRK